MTPSFTEAIASSLPGAIAFEAVYHSHEKTVWGWACRLLGPAGQAEVEDVVQDVFLALHRQLPGFRGDADIKTWLFRTTANVVSRRRRRQRVRARFARQEAAEPELAEMPVSPEIEAQQTVYRVLERLDERSRELIVWFEIEGLSGAEIAQLLDLKLATLWVRLHRARATFRAELLKLEAP